MHCLKLPGQRLRARDFEPQVAEFQIRVAVMNGFTALGIPVTETVGSVCPGKGDIQPSVALCNRVPSRYLFRLVGTSPSFGDYPIKDWSREEYVAFTLALLRITHGKGALLPDYQSYLRQSGHVLINLLSEVGQAKRDILDRRSAEKYLLPETASQLRAYQVFRPDDAE